MAVSNHIETIVSRFSEWAKMPYSKDLASRYEEKRNQKNGGESDRVVFARTLINSGNIDRCKHFLRHPANRRAMKNERQIRIDRRLTKRRVK